MVVISEQHVSIFHFFTFLFRKTNRISVLLARWSKLADFLKKCNFLGANASHDVLLIDGYRCVAFVAWFARSVAVDIQLNYSYDQHRKEKGT